MSQKNSSHSVLFLSIASRGLSCVTIQQQGRFVVSSHRALGLENSYLEKVQKHYFPAFLCRYSQFLEEFFLKEHHSLVLKGPLWCWADVGWSGCVCLLSDTARSGLLHHEWIATESYYGRSSSSVIYIVNKPSILSAHVYSCSSFEICLSSFFEFENSKR